jgi:hypothetical protein
MNVEVIQSRLWERAEAFPSRETSEKPDAWKLARPVWGWGGVQLWHGENKLCGGKSCFAVSGLGVGASAAGLSGVG